MMAPAFGVGSPSRTTAQQRTPADYRPGVCNIGPAEIERRRRVGHLGVAATVLLLIGLVVVNAPPIGRLLLVLPAAAAASGYLQALAEVLRRFWRAWCLQFRQSGTH